MKKFFSMRCEFIMTVNSAQTAKGEKMIQDIAPHIFHNEYRPEAKAADSSPVLCFDGKKILAKKEEGGLVFPLMSKKYSVSSTAKA